MTAISLKIKKDERVYGREFALACQGIRTKQAAEFAQSFRHMHHLSCVLTTPTMMVFSERNSGRDVTWMPVP
jgi:hypothetical protein